MRICNNFCFLGFVINFNIVWLLRIFRDRNILYIYVVLRSIIKILYLYLNCYIKIILVFLVILMLRFEFVKIRRCMYLEIKY